VDANEGWTDKEEAVRKINWLEKQGVEFIEQPMPAKWWKRPAGCASACTSRSSPTKPAGARPMIPKLKDAYDGVNVKLDKSGGILESWRMIEVAKSLGMKTMLGCMVSSSVLGDRRRAFVAAGGLRRSRRQPAGRQRPVPRRAGGKGQADSASARATDGSGGVGGRSGGGGGLRV
jgi:hypothetical protein